jgi:hypothetical protein
VSYAPAPLYALVHEACYADAGVVTGWSSDRVRADGVPRKPVEDGDGVARLPLTGENVYRDSVRSDPALLPLADAADLLAQRCWERPLYDRDRLARNTVPVAACVYERDMYVDPDLSRATAAATGSVTVVPDQDHHHDALRRNGPEILDRLEQALAAAAPDAVAPARPERGGGDS